MEVGADNDTPAKSGDEARRTRVLVGLPSPQGSEPVQPREATRDEEDATDTVAPHTSRGQRPPPPGPVHVPGPRTLRHNKHGGREAARLWGG